MALEPKPLISLPDWARLHYQGTIPHLNTLRKWARDALIQPAPERHGRAYYVHPDAKYVPPRRGRQGPAR